MIFLKIKLEIVMLGRPATRIELSLESDIKEYEEAKAARVH